MKATSLLCICVFSLSLANAAEDAGVSLRAPALASEPKAPTTPEQRKQITATTKALETDAFKLGATKDREAALWLIDHAPDIFPRLQDRIASDISNSGVPDWRPIYAQFIFGFVTFQLEHPKLADDAQAAYDAAVKSCLRVYRQAVARDTTNRLTFLDAADEHERSGTLAKYVGEIVAGLPTQRAK